MSNGQDKQEIKRENYIQLKLTSAAGMLAGCIGRVICHPFDTIKAKLYIQRNRVDSFQFQRQLISIIQATYRDEGYKGFYRGITINAIGAGPAFALYLTSYEYFKSCFDSEKRPFMTYMCAGFLAEAFSCVLWLPIDVVKERLQVQKNLEAYKYSGSVNALLSIIKSEGFKGIYRGYGATLVSFGTYSAIYFLIYENLKKRICVQVKKPSIWESMMASSGAFLSASIISNPLSISKLRFQVQRVNRVHLENQKANFDYRNIFDGVYKIYINEGARAFYKGFSMRLVYGGSITTITMSLAEVFRNHIKQYYEQKN